MADDHDDAPDKPDPPSGGGVADDHDKPDPPSGGGGVKNLPKIPSLSLLGLEGQHAVKLGRGVVGRMTITHLGFMVLLIAVTIKASGWLLLVIIAAGLVSYIAHMLFVRGFANRNPGAALLEGAELIKWKQLVGDDQSGLIEVIPSTVETPQKTGLVLASGKNSGREGADE